MENVYLSLGISLLTSFKGNYFECKSVEDIFETLVILSAVLLPIKSTVDSAVFLIDLFQAVFIASVADFLALPTSFGLYLVLMFFCLSLGSIK